MATETIVLALEGVLAGRDDDVDLASTMLDPVGSLLYSGLAASSRLILATSLDRRMVAHWCRTVGLAAHLDTTALDTKVVGRLRAGGDNPILYIDSNPERVAAAMRDGVPSMLFSRPLFARAGHRPDLVGERLPRPWSEITHEASTQQAVRKSMSVMFPSNGTTED